MTDPCSSAVCAPVMAVDVAIAGGGIVGLVMAAAFRGSGLRVAIIEPQTQSQAIHKPQAYALSLLSSKILQGLGVWEAVTHRVGHFERIQISDNDYPGQVPFTKGELGEAALGYGAEHQVLLGALEERVQGADNIIWLRPARLLGYTSEEKGLTVTVQQGEGETAERLLLTTPLLIGADGARSTVRSLAGIKTRGWKYWQSCIAFTVGHQTSPNATAFERFCDTGPMGILPLTCDAESTLRARSQIVWTLPHAQALALAALPEEEFLNQLRPRVGDRLQSITLVSPRRLFPVQLMQSDRYVESRLALVGDAAHCCHPVGGQGLNLGIRDGAALAQVILQAYHQGEDWGSLTVLKRYEAWRKPENWIILGFTDLLDRFFSSHWWPAIALRRMSLEGLRHIPPLKTLTLRLMTGLLGRRPHLAVPPQ